MITQKQKDYLETIPDIRVARVAPFNPATQKVAYKIISEIQSLLPALKIAYIGSSKLGVAGENDIDLNILAGNDFQGVIPVLTKLLGEPKKVKLEKKIIQWEFIRDDFPVEVFLTDVITQSLQEQFAVEKILENDKKLLQEFEKIKIQANGLPWKEYQKRKYEFWNKILGVKEENK